VEKVKKDYKQTQIQMVAQLEEIAKEAASLIQQSLSEFVFVLVLVEVYANHFVFIFCPCLL